MPKRSFVCIDCGEITSSYVYGQDLLGKQCNLCGSPAKVLPPTILGMDVTELVDQDRNVKWKQNQEEMIRERSLDYFYENEVPRLINEYSLKVCLEEGWIYYDEKGDLKVRKRPPQKG